MTDQQQTVLVLGATGTQGGAVVDALRERGIRIRAAVRTPDGDRARALRDRGVELVVVDQRERLDLERAMDGVDAVFSVQPNSGQPGSTVSDADEIEAGRRVVDAAATTGVRHVVYSSALAIRDGATGAPHLDTKIAVEEHLRGSGLRWTILRPATFMTTVVDGPPADDTIRFISAPDDPAHLVAPRDIGLAAARAVADAGTTSRTVEVVSESLSGNEMAAAAAAQWGRPVRYEQLVVDGDATLARIAGLFRSGTLGIRRDEAPHRRPQVAPDPTTFARWLAGA
jgi:uncharacterized protein YbjT (DUF2867 family)